MKPFLSRYAELSEFLDDRPDFRADWPYLALLAALGFCATLAVHLLEAPRWNALAYMAAGERILATHDAYCWLAGAKGVGGFTDFGMAALARQLARLTGAPLWAIGFYAPPVLGSLAAIVTGLWAWRLAGRRAAILAGLIGGLAPAFYYRSRLGYFDSDPFTLLMPLLLGLFLAGLIAPCCTRAWAISQAEREDPAPVPAWTPWLALAFGLVARVAHFAHDDIQPFGIGLFWLALGLAMLTALPGRRALALRLLTVYALAAYAGPRRSGAEVFLPGLPDLPGLLLATGAAWLAWRRPARLAGHLDRAWPWLAVLAAMVPACGLLLPLGPFWAKALSYFKPLADAGVARLASGEAGPSYPGITQSIREAKNIADFGLFFDGVSFSTIGGVAGLLGILALLALRPGFALLLPTTLLGFASLKLGARFAMFGGPAFALGLGVGMYWLTKNLAHSRGWSARVPVWLQGLLAAAILLAAYAPRYADTQPTPVLGAKHALALMDLKRSTPKDAVVWTWWDFGYATQYYAERLTPADGGRHAGRDIFPTALALTTDSFRQAAQVIRFSASQKDGPAARWDTMPALAVQRELQDLRERDLPLAPAPEQLLVVCWENVSLLYWLSFYGSWDVVAGVGGHAKVMQLGEAMNLDTPTGMLTVKSKPKPLPLASAEILGAEGVRRVEMKEHPEGAHLLINELSRQAMLLDDMAYNSMAVQLLIGDPDRPEQSRYFTLLHEGFPFVRIYKVLPGDDTPATQAEAPKQ
ncbi:MAG: STT3 domain-containing protein [Desulfovibrio sp.]